MKKLIVLIVLIGLMVTPFAAFAQMGGSSDEEEPRFTVPILADGDTAEGAFGPGASTQLYAFNATAGDSVVVTMDATDGSSVDARLVLLGTAGQWVATDDDGGEGLNSRIEAEIPTDGSYYIVATTFFNIRGELEESETETDLGFVISLTGNTLPEGFEADVTQISLGRMEIGDSNELFNSNAEPVYYIRFDGEAGQVVDVSLESEAFDALLYVFAPDGVRIAVSDDDGDGLNSLVSDLELPEDGVYLIFATTYGYQDGGALYSENAQENTFTISVTPK